MKVLFCQISEKLLNSKDKDISDKYYDSVYELHKEDGYVKPEHFWEIPLWIAELSFLIKDKELHIVENIDKSIEFINNSDCDLVLFSILDVNKNIVEQISLNIKKNSCAGGYSKPQYDFNLKYFDSIKSFCDFFNITYIKGTDYSLFSGYECIPRLQLSTGCKHKCKFCTVPNKVIDNNIASILQQVDSFRDLKFKLIYIDDKTFGQSKNHTLIKHLYRKIKSYNPDFNGFIVQSTAKMLKDISLNNPHLFNYIFAVEIGVEVFDDKVLKENKKPSSEKIILNAIKAINNLNVRIILNLMIGLPGSTQESYNKTLEFVSNVNLYQMNIYSLAVYKESQLAKEIAVLNKNDSNENIVEKYFNTKEFNLMNKKYYEDIFSLALNKLNNKECK